MDLYLQYIFVLCQSRGWRKQRKKMRRWAKNSAHLEIVMCDVWQPEITTVELDGRALWSTVSYVFASMKKNVISWCTTWRICLVRKLFIDCYRARKNLVYIQYICVCVCVLPLHRRPSWALNFIHCMCACMHIVAWLIWIWPYDIELQWFTPTENRSHFCILRWFPLCMAFDTVWMMLRLGMA